MSTVNVNKVDPLNEERSVIDNLIASSQNLMGSAENPVPTQCRTPTDYQIASSQKSQNAMKSRRGRTSFSPSQLSDLEAAFSNTHYPDFQTRKDLSKKLKIPDDRIQVWFQNRRAKWRKTQRQLNGPGRIIPYQNGQTPTTQNLAPPLPEISLVYNMPRPSPIRHTASLKGETNVSTVPVTQGNTVGTPAVSSNQQQQLTFQQLGNMLNIYEKVKPANVIPENQRAAPSLYSLSATVTSSGQYIVLGSHGGQPATYPVASYPLQVPALGNEKY